MKYHVTQMKGMRAKLNLCHVTWQMPSKLATEIDEYGRVLIPKEVRARANLKKRTKLTVSVKGSEIILTPSRVELQEKITELLEYLTSNSPKPFVQETRIDDSKWLSREYCLRKLGL